MSIYTRGFFAIRLLKHCKLFGSPRITFEKHFSIFNGNYGKFVLTPGQLPYCLDKNLKTSKTYLIQKRALNQQDLKCNNRTFIKSLQDRNDRPSKIITFEDLCQIEVSRRELGKFFRKDFRVYFGRLFSHKEYLCEGKYKKCKKKKKKKIPKCKKKKKKFKKPKDCV